MAFFASLGQQAGEEFDAAAQQRENFCLDNYRDAYNQVVQERGLVIDKMVDSGSTPQLLDFLESSVVLAHTYFLSYVDTVLRAPSGSINKTKEIADALGLADASQASINKLSGDRLRFNMNTLEPMIQKMLAATDDIEQIKTRLEEIYIEQVRDIVLNYIKTRRD